MAQNFLRFSSAGRKKMVELALIVIMMSSLFESGGCRSADFRTSDLFKVNGSKEPVEEICSKIASKYDLSHEDVNLVQKSFEVVNAVSKLTFDEIVRKFNKAWENYIFFDDIGRENTEIISVIGSFVQTVFLRLFGNDLLELHVQLFNHIITNMKRQLADYRYCFNNNQAMLSSDGTCIGYMKDMALAYKQ